MTGAEAIDEAVIDSYVCVVRSMIGADQTAGKIQRQVSDDDIRYYASLSQCIMKWSDEVLDRVVNKMLSQMEHRMDPGSMIMADHKSWYYKRSSEIAMAYTKRNLKYLDLQRHLSPNVISTLDHVTADIMDGLGDPQARPFKRYGLVMGDVQSGKTNTYTNLCCKAADTGYKVIIILTGTLEILRKQTQARLDEGLVGIDSAAFVKKKSKYVGVGNIDGSLKMACFTSTQNDFKGMIASTLGISVDNLSSPLLLVLKKNKRVLQNLRDWLETNTSKSINQPLLLIDDESDYASINTSSTEITAINEAIRGILSMFISSTYVGFTATPFANIFIDPNADQDLFPKDFIYCLNSPDNYIGPDSMYSAEGRRRYMLKAIPVKDPDQFGKGAGLPELPFDHKKEFVMTSMPASLREAVCCFMISCAIRDLRNQVRSHMTMMVNMSRFTDVQESVKDIIDDYVYKLQNAVESYGHLSEEEALKNSYMRNLKDAWADNYCGESINYPWIEIQRQLFRSIKPIVVRSVNQKNGPKNLNYADVTDGLRIIAVGGNSLSRGVTLEGLCISYFYRRSRSYDTLMQMGRWFGYRDGYDDLCRVWMTQESIDWYRQISEATEELKWEFKLMYEKNKTPKDFGLRVRNDVNGLLITSREKMRYSSDELIIKSLEGSGVWTSSVYIDDEHRNENNRLVCDFVNHLMELRSPYYNKLTKNWVWQKVPNQEVIKFLSKYQYPVRNNLMFNVDSILEMIKSDDFNDDWDIAIQHGDGKVYHIPGVILPGDMPITCVCRSNIGAIDSDSIRFSSASLMSPNNMREGIYQRRDKFGNQILDEHGHEIYDEDRINEMEKTYCDEMKKKSASYKAYLKDKNRRPSLLIYLIEVTGSKDGSDSNPKAEEAYSRLKDKTMPPVGIALGFPEDPDRHNDAMTIKYKTNKIYNDFGNEDLDEE